MSFLPSRYKISISLCNFLSQLLAYSSTVNFPPCYLFPWPHPQPCMSISFGLSTRWLVFSLLFCVFWLFTCIKEKVKSFMVMGTSEQKELEPFFSNYYYASSDSPRLQSEKNLLIYQLAQFKRQIQQRREKGKLLTKCFHQTSRKASFFNVC